MNVILLIFSLALAPLGAGAEPLSKSPSREPIDFETFVKLSSRKHPLVGIDLLSEKRAAFIKKKLGNLPDPEITLGKERLPFRGAANHATEEMVEDPPLWKVTITQSFPWPGTLTAENHLAETSLARTKADNKLKAVQRELEAKEIFIKLVTLAQVNEIERENLQKSSILAKNSEARLKQGIGSYHELIQAQNETSTISLNLSALRGDFINLQDYAAQLIGEQDSEGITFSSALPAAYVYSRTTAQNLPKESPSIDLNQERISALRDESLSKISAERSKSLPSLMVSAMAMQEDTGMKTYGVMAGIRIPLFSGSVRSALEGDGDVVAQNTREELSWYDKRKHLAITQNNRRIALLNAQIRSLNEEILPKMKQHFSTLANEYAQGNGSFAAVNNARRLYLRYRVALLSSQQDFALTVVAREGIAMGILQGGAEMANPQLPSYSVQGGEMGAMPSGAKGTMNKGSQSMGGDQNKGMKKPGASEGMKDEEPAAIESGMGGMQ